MTVIVVTHEADVARFAGRAIRFHDGLVVDQEMVAAPADADALLAAQPPVAQVAAAQ